MDNEVDEITFSIVQIYSFDVLVIEFTCSLHDAMKGWAVDEYYHEMISEVKKFTFLFVGLYQQIRISIGHFSQAEMQNL